MKWVMVLPILLALPLAWLLFIAMGLLPLPVPQVVRPRKPLGLRT